ncbi:glycogenin [Colletotrichum plurivorum]|uniref:glycogenin glucosyltransferase n=1 Tax=Colletotrichum plurivorum TaxID=2175906 RepID=A0A8H6KSJ8_9PEZI|nr:glycogenin [Colletotrichum plurivorum]
MGSLDVRSDVAYCTLVTNDNYVVAAAVLAESLRKTGTTIPRCVLVTPETMSQPALSKLEDVFEQVIPVSTVTALTTDNLAVIGRPDLHATMTKIRLWSLTQFRRVLYLDADTLVVSGLDHLFDLPEAVYFAAAPEIGFPDCFNSGVMLLRPDAGTFAELSGLAGEVDSFDGGDQGLLNIFFGDGTRGHPSRLLLKKPDDEGTTTAAAAERNWFRLSFTYNMEMHKVYRFYIPAALRYRDEHKVLHFIGRDKPWHFDEGKIEVGEEEGAYQRFYADMVGKCLPANNLTQPDDPLRAANMGRDLQKKKRRSGRQKIKQPNKPKKLLNPLGNSIIAKNWNKKETLTQNYRRLGLTARLKGPTGGVEKTLAEAERERPNVRDPFAIAPVDEAIIGEARVERDADGKIVRIHYGKSKRANPLNDPLNQLEDEDEEEDDEKEEWGGIDDESRPEVIRLLEKEAARPTVKKVRHASQQEREWLESLIAKHGDDTAAMARDRKLNPMQQTEADIARRIRKFTGKA